MKIMFVGSEATPFAKTGGLADVLGSLPQSIAKLGHTVSLIMPAHKEIKNSYLANAKNIVSFTVTVHDQLHNVDVYELKHDVITVYFIDNDYYFGKLDHLYGEFDDGERYGCFNQAVLKTLMELNMSYDILHVNDWHAGLLPYMLKSLRQQQKNLTSLKTIMTIHNIAYQGVFSKLLLPNLGIKESPALLHEGFVNFLKAGIMHADYVSTVSETYAKELETSYFGMGLEKAIQARRGKIIGIMNGLDYDTFNPNKDQAIHQTYSVKDVINKKPLNKTALLKTFYLEASDLPVFGIVSRLTEAKGFPLILEALEPLLKSKAVKLVILGSGDKEIEQQLSHLKSKYAKHVGVYFGYSDAIARKIYAGADFFLMPSRFEPCGLAQLISLCYGTIPIVRETGGLKDSILDYTYHKDKGSGFTFAKYESEALLEAIENALSLYKDIVKRHNLVKKIMTLDFSWNKSARKYIDLYQKVMEEKQ